MHPSDPDLRIWLRQYREFDKGELQEYHNELKQGYLQKAKNLNKEQKITWLYEVGHVQTNLDLTDFAHQSFNKALTYSNKEETPKAYFMLNFGKAFLYRQNNNPEKSNKILAKLLKLATELGDIEEQIHVKYWMAENHHKLGEYEEALELGRELYTYSIESGDYTNASYNLILLGLISAKIDQDTSYFNYYKDAIELAKRGKASNVIGSSLYATGSAYQNAGFSDFAIDYFKKANKYIKYFTPRERINFLDGFSNTYLALDSVQLALSYTQESLALSQRIKGELWQADAYSNLAMVFFKMATYDSALIYQTKALELYKEGEKSEMVVNTYHKLSEVHVKLNNYQLALSYLDSSYHYSNELTSNSNANVLAKVRTNSDYYLQKSEINKLSLQNLANKNKAKQMRHLSIGAGILLVLIVLFYFFNRVQLKHLQESHLSLLKKNNELDELNKRLLVSEAKSPKRNKSKEIKNEDYLFIKLNNLLHNEEVYTDSSLSLKTLAADLNTNTSYLSSIINKHFNCNFKTLVNKLRTNKAKEILRSGSYEKMSMEGVAIEVGFKSRSGFYQSFKSFTGLTPTQFISSHQILDKSAKTKS